jgi:hypothetical protein
MLSRSDINRLSNNLKSAESIAHNCIIQDINREIKNAATIGHKFVTFDVPPIHPDIPAFDYKLVSNMLKETLIKGDFDVVETDIGILSIGWPDAPPSKTNTVDDVVKIIYSKNSNKKK